MEKQGTPQKKSPPPKISADIDLCSSSGGSPFAPKQLWSPSCSPAKSQHGSLVAWQPSPTRSNVRYLRNFTEISQKFLNSDRMTGVSISNIYDLSKLSVRTPHNEPLSTGHFQNIIAFIFTFIQIMMS